MKNIFTLFCIVIGLAFSTTVFAQSQSEMNSTAGASLEKADATLNRIYKKILAQHADNKQFCGDLKEAQRAWLKFVDFHLKTVFPLKENENPRQVYGSIYPLEFATTKTSLIEQRIEQLKDFVDNPTN